MIMPSRRLLTAVALWAGLALLMALSPLFSSALTGLLWWLWSGAGAVLGTLTLLDLALAWRRPAPLAERRLPAAFAAGQPGTVQVRLRSASFPPGSLLADQHPGDDAHTGLPVALSPAQDEDTLVEYPYRPARRGVARFGAVRLWCPSPLGWWQRRHDLPAASEIPVYPDFSWLRGDGLADTPQIQRQQGRHLRRSTGDGQEFHQLRDYRPGDTLRQVDWRATARRGSLISREYRDEQNRHLILLLDGGQRMAPAVGARTVFDHALDASLLLASSALDQGDRPGLMLFSGQQPLWVPPLRNRSSLNLLLNQVYPLHPGELTSDYSSAAGDLLLRWRRQALVVLITRLQPDDSDDLLHAIRLLRGRSRILIGDMQLPDQQALARADVIDVDQALRIAADAQFQQARQALYARLRHAGVMVTDGTPQTLPGRLNRLYLSLRRAGRL